MWWLAAVSTSIPPHTVTAQARDARPSSSPSAPIPTATTTA